MKSLGIIPTLITLIVMLCPSSGGAAQGKNSPGKLLPGFREVDVGLPTSLTCTSNAKATRDYGFVEKRWMGQKGHMLEPSRTFVIITKNLERRGYLRDKVFSGLNTENPIVRSITRYEDGVEGAVELKARVVSRFSDAVFLIWTNPYPDPNKVWLAAIDLKHRKVTLTHVFQGATSVGGELETLDCR